jgi:hypothetical protein
MTRAATAAYSFDTELGYYSSHCVTLVRIQNFRSMIPSLTVVSVTDMAMSAALCATDQFSSTM